MSRGWKGAKSDSNTSKLASGSDTDMTWRLWQNKKHTYTDPHTHTHTTRTIILVLCIAMVQNWGERCNFLSLLSHTCTPLALGNARHIKLFNLLSPRFAPSQKSHYLHRPSPPGAQCSGWIHLVKPVRTPLHQLLTTTTTTTNFSSW